MTQTPRTLVLNYLLADVQLRQLRADDAFAAALASVAADLQRLIDAEKPMPWGELPVDAQWVAMDADRQWFWYTHRPVRLDDVWNPAFRGTEFGSFLYRPATNWRDSLQQRPEPK